MATMSGRFVLVLLVAFAALHGRAAAGPDVLPVEAALPAAAAAAARGPTAGSACTLIESAATAHGLPVDFLTRLIWKESAFRSTAISPKGAQGIAQFMPATAAERGLADPFDPAAAIPASAALLRDLAGRFGNLGLAAAAYNAGGERVGAWLAGRARLPAETQDYVAAITGRSAAEWASPELARLPLPPVSAKAGSCADLVALLARPGAAARAGLGSIRAPWGVQVAGNFSQTRALQIYAELQRRFPSVLAGRAPMILRQALRNRGAHAFHQVRVPAPSRAAAEALCARLRRAGGYCIVRKT